MRCDQMLSKRATARKDSGLSAPSSVYSGSQGYHLCQTAAEAARGPVLGPVAMNQVNYYLKKCPYLD